MLTPKRLRKLPSLSLSLSLSRVCMFGVVSLDISLGPNHLCFPQTMLQSTPHTFFIGVAKPGGLRGWYFSDLQSIDLMAEISYWAWTSTFTANSHTSRVDRLIDMQWSEESMGLRYNK